MWSYMATPVWEPQQLMSFLFLFYRAFVWLSTKWNRHHVRYMPSSKMLISQMGLLLVCHLGSFRPSAIVRLFIHQKWGRRICRERFDLELPNFTRASIPVWGLQPHWIWCHYLLLVTTYRHSKHGRKMITSGGISWERFKRGSKNYARLSWTIDPTNVLNMA